MVDIQSAMAEIRRGKKKEERKKEEETTGQNIMACSIPQGGHNQRTTSLQKRRIASCAPSASSHNK